GGGLRPRVLLGRRVTNSGWLLLCHFFLLSSFLAVHRVCQAAVRGRRRSPTVRLGTRDSKVYYVLGEVNAPGAFPLRGRETVLDGIVAAGGLNSNASRNNIILSRPTHPD